MARGEDTRHHPARRPIIPMHPSKFVDGRWVREESDGEMVKTGRPVGPGARPEADPGD